MKIQKVGKWDIKDSDLIVSSSLDDGKPMFGYTVVAHFHKPHIARILVQIPEMVKFLELCEKELNINKPLTDFGKLLKFRCGKILKSFEGE